jgi:hypothetical protein
MAISRTVVLCVAALLIVNTANAQTKPPQETRNAALRYWLAFADMQDPPSDPATSTLLRKTAAGEAPWDEAKLGAILDKNEAAILRMQRATKLPDCDWGLEYSDGPTASIAYVLKARVMASLNTLYGMREAAKGNDQTAAEAWLDGIRFSQHIAQDGPLIFALIGKAALLPNLRAMTQAVRSGKIPPRTQRQFDQMIRALPDSIFDWSNALSLEENGIVIFVQQLADARDPAEKYNEVTGARAPAGFSVPTASERAAYHRFMVSTQDAFRLPPMQTETKLPSLHEELKSLSPFFQGAIPSLDKMNEARTEIATAREQLLQALEAK